MNSRESRWHALVDEQAAGWAARLDGGRLEAAERAELDVWLSESPTHRAALSDYCQLSADLEAPLTELVASGAVSLPSACQRVRRRGFPRVATLALAAAALISMGVWVALPSPHVQNIATAVAQRRAETLADGTRVELNAHTSLRFENSKSERRVRLGGGEALFSVAKDHSRPFIVETPSGSVRVTGTVFNIRNEPAATHLEVTVLEGSVHVRPSALGDSANAGAFSLAAGEQLTAGIRGVDVQTLSRGTIDDVVAWRDGAVVFKGVPLHEVVARFAHYHGRRIFVHPSVANESVGGRFGLDDFGAFIAALEVALPVKVAYDLSGAVTIHPRAGAH